MYVGSSYKKRREVKGRSAAAGSRSVHSAPPADGAAAPRQLVEDYWRSVLVSKHDAPLYHTFSDRYGGTAGVPFAARTDCSAVLKGWRGNGSSSRGLAATADGTSAAAGTSRRSVQNLMDSSDAALAAGDLQRARAHLEEALTQIQNSVDGGATIASLTKTRSLALAPNATGTDSAGLVGPTAEILLRMSKLAILSNAGEEEEALRLLALSAEADPLNPQVYVLRAACLERLGRPGEAYHDYEHYLRMEEPTLEVVAHCGKCAAEAGYSAEAATQLQLLLRLTNELETAAAAEADPERAAALRRSASFYRAHANFYLGFTCVKQANEAEAAGGPGDARGAKLREEALAYFRRATSNESFIRSYEMHVDEAIMTGEFEAATESLRALQLMSPERADYCLRLAHMCHMSGDSDGELRALSDALDRQQSLSERRATLLARGTLYAEVAGQHDRAIKDFTLVVSLPADAADDCSTPLAYLRRAEAHSARQTRADRSPAHRREDQEAALLNYELFLDEMRPLQGRAAEAQVCDPRYVTDAMLILADGAFRRADYSEATRHFADAISRGWVPLPPNPRREQQQQQQQDGAASAATIRPVPPQLHDEMYIALAHHVQAAAPTGEEMFRVPYEPREWVAAAPDLKRSKAQEKKEADKPSFSAPSLMYTMADMRYNSLKALEPTVFTALEYSFISLWGPYRAEVDRTRDDVMVTRNRKGKRHV